MCVCYMYDSTFLLESAVSCKQAMLKPQLLFIYTVSMNLLLCEQIQIMVCVFCTETKTQFLKEFEEFLQELLFRVVYFFFYWFGVSFCSYCVELCKIAYSFIDSA